MKTLLTSLTLALGLQTQPAQAFGERDQLQLFASCAGRLSAVMEFQWLFDGTASERTKQQRDALLDLVVAIVTPDQGVDVLDWRISAKQAQYALLSRTVFNEDPSDAAWAVEMSDRLTAECTGLILG